MKKFRKSSIRKVYDSLHGISNKAIPLANAVEIMAYCLIDGKVEQKSSFETKLYNNLVEQFKKMKDGFAYMKNLNIFKLTMAKKSQNPYEHMPKRTLALIWIYLQIIGTPVERLSTEENLRTFDRNDFEKACMFLVLRNPTHKEPREVSRMRLQRPYIKRAWSND